MKLGFVYVHDMPHFDAVRFQPIGDQRAMTAPPHSFGAHDRSAFVPRQFQQRFHSRAKPRRLHVIRVTAKRFVAPDRVARIRTRMPASAEFRKRNIFDAGIHQRRAQRLRIELRMLARSGVTAHVRERLDRIVGKQIEKLGGRPRRVADGPDRQCFAAHAVKSPLITIFNTTRPAIGTFGMGATRVAAHNRALPAQGRRCHQGTAMPIRVVLACLLLALFGSSPAFAAEHDKSDAKPAAEAKAKSEAAPQEKSVATQHSVTINGRSIAYTATAGTLIIRNEKGEPDASVFYVAYTVGGSKGSDNRPVTFLYNGGPGSSSIWLHMG